MSEDHTPRLFHDDADIRHIGEGLLARTLDRSEWTHEAHLAACVWIITERPDIHPEHDLADIIRRYNESVGGVNDETQGYHETITQCFIRGARAYLRRCPDGSLTQWVNGLFDGPRGTPRLAAALLQSGRLFSVKARLGLLDPDLQELPGGG